MIEYSREFLISELHRYVEIYGEKPSAYKLRKAEGFPSVSAYLRAFKSWNEAMTLAGLAIETEYKNEYLLDLLKDFYKTHGRSPDKNDMGPKNGNGLPSVDTYARRFKSWNNALKLCGLPLNQLRNIDRKYLIKEFKRAYKELGRIPSMTDFKVENGYPERSTFYHYFNTYEEILEASGFSLDDIENIRREQLIEELKEVYNKLGRLPYEHEMRSEIGCSCSATYCRYFKTWNAAIISAGFDPRNIRYEYDGTESCAVCGKTNVENWRHIDGQPVCENCYRKDWIKKNPMKAKLTKHKMHSKRKGYGYIPLNDKFEYSNGHHLWINGMSDAVIFLPEFLHLLNWHSSKIESTMDTVNAIALDYWINEDLYNSLYLEGEL